MLSSKVIKSQHIHLVFIALSLLRLVSIYRLLNWMRSLFPNAPTLRLLSPGQSHKLHVHLQPEWVFQLLTPANYLFLHSSWCLWTVTDDVLHWFGVDPAWKNQLQLSLRHVPQYRMTTFLSTNLIPKYKMFPNKINKLHTSQHSSNTSLHHCQCHIDQSLMISGDLLFWNRRKQE